MQLDKKSNSVIRFTLVIGSQFLYCLVNGDVTAYVYSMSYNIRERGTSYFILEDLEFPKLRLQAFIDIFLS